MECTELYSPSSLLRIWPEGPLRLRAVISLSSLVMLFPFLSDTPLGAAGTSPKQTLS